MIKNRDHFVAWLSLLGSVLFAGCASPSKAGLDRSAPVTDPARPTNHPRIVSVHTNSPLHRPTTAQKFNPCFWFGNVDDPLPPEDYRPEDPHRVGKWHWRNSCHNFTFYVMGIADKEFVRTGRCPEVVFSPNGGWNWAVCKYKWLRLPFVSHQRKRFKFYVGWRERGNFGMKLNF